MKNIGGIIAGINYRIRKIGLSPEVQNRVMLAVSGVNGGVVKMPENIKKLICSKLTEKNKVVVVHNRGKWSVFFPEVYDKKCAVLKASKMLANAGHD